jgi:hypothetical protein
VANSPSARFGGRNEWTWWETAIGDRGLLGGRAETECPFLRWASWRIVAGGIEYALRSAWQDHAPCRGEDALYCAGAPYRG